MSQAWRATKPLTFLESNGLSAMGYSLPAAMAAKLEMPDRPVLCTVGDGGFSMVFADLETCVRHRIHVVTVVYNDSALSLIDVAQKRRGYADCGVHYGHVNFAAASAALGAWGRRVHTMEELQDAVKIGVDYLALSFVRRPDDIEELRKLVPATVKLVAKIEKATALDNLDRIVAVSDAVGGMNRARTFMPPTA